MFIIKSPIGSSHQSGHRQDITYDELFFFRLILIYNVSILYRILKLRKNESLLFIRSLPSHDLCLNAETSSHHYLQKSYTL